MSVPVRQVELQAVPISLLRGSEEQVQSVLAAAEQAIEAGGQSLTASLAMVVRSLTEEYGDLSSAVWSEVDAAEADGRTEVDLHLEGPVTLASAVETWLRLLEHLDDLRATGLFEHPETSPDVVRFRRWMVEEVSGQMRQRRPAQPFLAV